MWGWFANVLSTLFGWIPRLIWNGFVIVWDSFIGPVFYWVFVDFLWHNVLLTLGRLFRFKMVFFAAISLAYTILRNWVTRLLDFVIDCAFDLVEYFLGNIFNFGGSPQQYEGFLEIFKYYSAIDVWIPLTEGISFFVIYMTAWFLMLAFKIALKIWQAMPGT